MNYGELVVQTADDYLVHYRNTTTRHQTVAEFVEVGRVAGGLTDTERTAFCIDVQAVVESELMVQSLGKDVSRRSECPHEGIKTTPRREYPTVYWHRSMFERIRS